MAAPTTQALSLSFAEPNGTVGANDVIPIIVSIRNTTDTDFVFDGNDPDNFYGIPGIEVPSEGFNDDGDLATFGNSPNAFLNFSFTCSGSFFTAGGTPFGACPPGDEYEFVLFSDREPFFADSFELMAGASVEFEFGQFIPLAGGATPGDYDFFGVSLFLDLFGFGEDEGGNEIFLTEFIDIASTCTTGDSTCAFTRTVAISPVPLPASAWLLFTALRGLFGARKYRHA